MNVVRPQPSPRRGIETSLGLVGLSTLLLGVSCTSERDPIDRTQPNQLPKSFFVGEDLLGTQDDPEFWFQGTLVDVGYGASQSGLFTSTYAQPMSRIKWVIQEDTLVARLTYERIDGSDGKGAGAASRDGQVVAAYRIVSHFDVRRAYNSVTGEEMNVLEENTVDRPWYEREYIRVDWSQNLSSDAYELDTLSMLGIYGGIQYTGFDYYVNDPTDPNAPVFAPDEGYLDITNRAYAAPGSIDLSHLGWGIDSFPSCWLPNDFMGGTEPVGNCNPVELTIRNSFRKVVDHDYQPMDWDGYRFQAYGAFTTDRRGYDRRYGMSDEDWHRFISRYDIWQRSHYYSDPVAMTGAVECFTDATPYGGDANRDENNDGTADECASVGNGSQCDTFSQKCTLPYRQRELRPMVWYYTKESHPDYFDPTFEAAGQWDAAMRVAVSSARYAECVSTGGEAAACRAQYPVPTGQQSDNDDLLNLVKEVDDCRYGKAYAGQDCNSVADQVGNDRGYDAEIIALAKMDEMVILCHSPVTAADPAACGAEGLDVRMGDLRYHQINVIPHPQSPSPWGIYTDSHDPLTGETIAASVNVWSHVNDLWAQQVVDKLRYIFGEITTEEITDGEYIDNWVAANQASMGGGILPGLSRDEAERRVASVAGASVEKMHNVRANLRGTDIARQVKEKRQQLAGVRADALQNPSQAAVYETRRQRAVNTNTEAALNTAQMQQLAGVQGLPVSTAMKFSSPLQGNHPGLIRDIERLTHLGHAEHHTCMRYEAPSPTSLRGLGEVLQRKFGSFDANQSSDEQLSRMEAMHSYLKRQAHFSVILHEMGHSMGERHNFVSSSDAMNFRPQYWQLRTKNKSVTTDCTSLVADGATCVGPRYFDPVSTEEQQQLIWMFMHSSVMDYAGEATQDLLGLGAYDFAAVRMFYADVVSVHDDASYALSQPRGQGVVQKLDNFGGILGFTWTGTDGTDSEIHYSALDNNYDLIQDCQAIDATKYRPASWDESVDGVWDPLLDGKLVSIDGTYSRCRQQAVDYVPWNQLRSIDAAEAGTTFLRAGPAVDASNRPRVAYGFATDRWADLGNVAVYRHDNGADAYELFNFFITEQEVNHIFDNYRRGRSTFSVRSAANRALGRYNEKMRDGAKGLGLYANIYRDFALEIGYDYEGLWPFIIGMDANSFSSIALNALSAGIAFDHFTRLMARPEAGEHFLQDGVLMSSNDVVSTAGATAMIVPNGPTGLWQTVGIGGKPVENALAEDKGEYDSEFTINAGSYYDKVFSTMLLTESVDNFISDSRRDFVDGRYRAVSMADLFPDGYRRWIANNLTNDTALKGVFVASSAAGAPMVGSDMYPTQPLGWTSWWGDEPQVCFPASQSAVCANPAGTVDLGGQSLPVTPIDPQVGWEQQKFLIAWTLMYLPENQQRWWLDQMSIWSVGEDSDPGFENRIELHDPSGKVYVAKTYGKETIFGETVQKGIGARILEYGNELVQAAYQTTDGPDIDKDGSPDWYVPTLGADGTPVVRYDPSIEHVLPSGAVSSAGSDGCNRFSFAACRCDQNRACIELSRYVSVPNFMRESMRDFGMAPPSMRGLY